MKYFLFSVFFLILVVLFVVYINISSINIEENLDKAPVLVEKKEEKTIIKLLANTEVKEVFPAKELYLKVDLNYIPKTKILYQTIINDLDKYKLFGIEQVLSLNNIKYSIINSKNNLKLFINFDKKEQAKKIQTLFKSYDFKVKLKKVKIKG